ncbi:hypothetical protein QTP88_025511 [Uroleucon formosanum]
MSLDRLNELLHSSIMSQVKEYKILKMSGNSKKDILKQTKLFHSGPNKSCSKQEVNELVFEYIICEIRPLVTVEKRSFKKLILRLTHSNDESIIPNRKQILQLLKNSYNSYVSMLSDLIQKSKLICTTADIWSGNNKSYLGMTCHFIDPITYERKSFVLGCKRIIGCHTYLNITETMTCMTQEYNIHYSKISHTVTDNASNFAKAFKTFSTSVKSTQSTTLSVGDLNEDGSPFEDSDVETENITVVDIGQLFTNSEDQNIDESFCLPPHMRCCAHTLNLISTTDIKKIKDASYINISESTFIKLFSFWTLISRSTVASDKILEKCGCKFPTPVVTRWNSLYDSSLKVLKYKQQLTKAFDDLHLIKLKLSEWTFLEKYCQVMEPLAISLDKLQGENNSFLGYVAPTILVLRRLLISFTDLKYCKPLSFAIIQAIETRFNYILDLSRPESKDFIIASMSHPKFKLSWVPLRYMKLCKNLFISECCLRINTETKSTNLTIAQSDKDDSDDDFFDSICNDNDFTSPSESESRNSNLANLQALSFLNLKKKDLDILNDFPVIKEVFLKYNTTIPSSAAVERLFSKAVQVLTTRRNRLSDDTFQMLLCCRSKYDI